MSFSPLSVLGAIFAPDVKKLQKESVVCPRTALFQRNLDGRQLTETTQDTSTETR